MNHKNPKPLIPTDGRTLTLYQSRQRGRLYWYVCWQDDQGKVKHHYVGKEMPAHLLPYWDAMQTASERLQAAIRVYCRIQRAQARKEQEP